jgi:GT2 family glycosyltransferase
VDGIPSLGDQAAGGSLAAVVVSYNSAGDLPSCLDALEHANQVEQVLVVDNASTDGSAEVARSLGLTRLEVLELEHNTGFAGGCNRGFVAVGDPAEWIAVLNPDVVVEPECLARCVDALKADPALAAVAPRLMRPDLRTVDSVGQVLDRRTLEVRDRGYDAPLEPELLEERDVLSACGALAVFRRTALEQVAEEGGPWAEHFFCFWEDLELGWRLCNSGWRIAAVPEAVAVHGRGAGAARGRGPLRWRRPARLEACVLSNRWMTLARHLHTADLVRRLPLLLAWDSAMVVTSTLRRPPLLRHVVRRLTLVRREWRQRRGRQRRRLRELPL